MYMYSKFLFLSILLFLWITYTSNLTSSSSDPYSNVQHPLASTKSIEPLDDGQVLTPSSRGDEVLSEDPFVCSNPFICVLGLVEKVSVGVITTIQQAPYRKVTFPSVVAGNSFLIRVQK